MQPTSPPTATRPAPTVRDVEDTLTAYPLLPAIIVMTPRDRGYAPKGMTAGWAVYRSEPILVHWCAPNAADERKGLDHARRALRTAGFALQRCWDPDEGEYLAVVGWDGGTGDADRH